MGFFSADLEGMIDIFAQETLEMMEEYDAHLLPAAQGQGLTAEDVQALFRVVHTIKSSAAMMGLEAMNRCAHHLEDAMALLRDDPARLSGDIEQLLDAMYAFADYVRAEIDRLADADYSPADAGALEEKIGGALRALSGEKAQGPESIQRAWRVLFKPDCPMVQVRALVLVKQAAARCSALTTDPVDLEQAGAEARLNAQGLALWAETTSPEEVRSHLAASPYVDRVEDILPEAPAETPREDAEPAKEPAAPSPSEEPAARAARFATIPWGLVERLQSLTGELTTGFMLLKTAIERSDAAQELETLVTQSGHQLNELAALAQQTSLLPVSSVVGQYYRTIRDICREEGKQARLEVRGEELEVDRTLLDALATPLLHLFRNAVDHGMETPAERARLGKDEVGCVTLSVSSTGGRVKFVVSDDGKGMDDGKLLDAAQKRGLLDRPRESYTRDEALQLAFLPGFSTSSETTRYSGRGVGMDVVARAVEGLGGVVHVTSEKGQGTTVTMEMPVSMTSCDSLQFSVGEYRCLLPVRSVKRILDWDSAAPDLRRADGRLWLRQGEALLPLMDLFERYDAPAGDARRVLVLQGLRQDAAVVVGPIDGHLVVVERPLPELLRKAARRQSGISGCAVTGDGSLGLSLDPEQLIRMAAKGGAEA